MTIPSTKKLLILTILLLVMILAVLTFMNLDKFKNMFLEKQGNSIEAVVVDTPEIRFHPKQDSLMADFKSLKNDTIFLSDEIKNWMATELESFNWNNEFQVEDLFTIYHETVFVKQLPFDSKLSNKLIVITFSNHNGNLYHSARGKLSLFEFQQENQNWQMTRKYLAFGIGTEYGLEPLWCNLVQIGSNDKFALIVQTNYSGNGGHDVETQWVYAEVSFSFKLVFDFTNYEYYYDYPNDIEYTEGYSTMRILVSNKEWFDIETKSDGTKWGDVTPDAVKRFEFDGEEYVEYSMTHIK